VVDVHRDRREESMEKEVGRGTRKLKYETPQMKKHEPVKTVTYGSYCSGYLYYTVLYYYH
jgi:hypothetical protein